MSLKHKAVLELILAGALWGFGFVATIWALETFTSNQVVFLRFILAWTTGFALELFVLKDSVSTKRLEYRSAFWPGILLCAFMFLQTYGLKTTTATKSSFITTLYVLFVPLLNAGFFKQKIHWLDFPLAVIALGGMYFLLGANLSTATAGDWITLLAAFIGALHIIFVGFAARKSSSAFTFNNAQSFWVMLASLFLLLLPETHRATSDQNAWFGIVLLKPVLGIIFLAVCSSLIAFTIQVRAQKILSDQTASQLFLLEAPFSFFFALMFLGETLTALQITGAGVILFCTFLSTKTELGKTN